MRKRDIFSLLVACREVTHDKDGQRHVYIDEEKTVKNLPDLKKAINALPKEVQEEYRLTQARVRMFGRSYRIKYPDLRKKAHAIYVPGLIRKGKEKPIEIVATGNKETSVKPEQGE